MEVLLRIGEMADMFEISVRTLHLYDKIGLFKPEYIDESSGYRYYTPDQIHMLNSILSFKKVGFTLMEIKNILEHHFNPKVLLTMLRGKIQNCRKQIDVLQFNIENMEKMVEAIEDCEKNRQNKELNQSEQEIAVRMSRISCLENSKLENFFSEILWL